MNGFVIFLLIALLLALLGICAGGIYILKAFGETFEHLERGRIRTDSAMEKMGTQINSIRSETAGTLTYSKTLASQVRSMADVMSNAKRRGNWGEYQLEHLIRTYMGDSPYLYSAQYHLENGKISDGAFHLPQTERVLCIDSKFPMENYVRMCENPDEAESFERELRKNLRKHIQDVSEKYITDQTLDEALLFIPSEAIYQWICGEGSDLLEFALSRHVLLVSPTTLCGVVFSLNAATRDFYRAKNMESFEKQVRLLEDQAEALCEQTGRTIRSTRSLQKNLEDIRVQSEHLLAEIQKGAQPVFDDPMMSDYDYPGDDRLSMRR